MYFLSHELAKWNGGGMDSKKYERPWYYLFNARPHPGPLPRERGNCFQCFCKKVASWFMGSMCKIFGGNIILTLYQWKREQPLKLYLKFESQRAEGFRGFVKSGRGLPHSRTLRENGDASFSKAVEKN